jgi:hypothetical protein
MTLCYSKAAATSSASEMHKLYTLYGKAVITTGRLQLALENGLTIEQVDTSDWKVAKAFTTKSLEPMKVLALGRWYGLRWNDLLTSYAAEFEKYKLMEWLLKCGCPWNPGSCLLMDIRRIEHMKQLRAITGPWPIDRLNGISWSAALHDCALDTVKWCREQGAAWPESFYDHTNAPYGNCWSLNCVEWALANGSTWLTWRCQDLAPHQFHCRLGIQVADHSEDACKGGYCDRRKANELFVWAHENGCPCTC